MVDIIYSPIQQTVSSEKALPEKALLPDKMHALIRVALRDLEAVEKNPQYEIYMGTWHDAARPVRSEPCYVCFAGAVMANTLGVSPTCSLSPVDFPDHIESKLLLLDAIRKGEIESMLDGLPNETYEAVLERIRMTFGDKFDEFIGDVEVPLYGVNPQGFKNTIKKIADILEEFDI